MSSSSVEIDSNSGDSDNVDALEVTQDSDDGSEEETCLKCGQKPCCFVTYKEEIDASFLACDLESTVDDDGNNIQKRYICYRNFIFSLYGNTLGKGHRVPIPICIEEAIKLRYPDKKGKYKGFLPMYDYDAENKL